MNILYAIPAALLLIVALAIALLLAGVGQYLVHRRFQQQDFIAHNEVGGIIIAVAGTLYAVVLGFLTVVVWQHFQEARELVVTESDANIDAWHAAVGLPPAIRARVRNDMVAYTDLMIHREWPAMRRGEFDETAPMIDMDAYDAAGSFVPVNEGQSNAQAATLQQLTQMHDARQKRTVINGDGVSGFEWLVLLLGACCIIAFCWLFGLRNIRVQMLMTSAVVAIIVSTLVLLFELQYPFRSDIGIGPQAWTNAARHIHQMQSGMLMNMRN